MKNLENIIFLNKEIIVKEILSDNPLDNTDDSDDLEKLIECEIVSLGLEVSDKFKIGDTIVAQRESLRKKRYSPLEKGKLLVILHENSVFCKIK
jgi:hypothetical protein